MQLGFFFDQERCIGCHTCSVACNDKNNLPDRGVHWRRVRLLERGQYPDVRLVRLSLSCNHCAEPACVAACPAGAISKREADGVVVVDRGACLGGDACGRLCLDACPYGVPQFGEEPNPKMQKCDFCLDRLEDGEAPICVSACPMLALAAGPLEELERTWQVDLTTEGMPDPIVTRPSLRFRGGAGKAPRARAALRATPTPGGPPR